MTHPQTQSRTASTSGRAPLSWRAEARRQLSRRRTLWSFVLIVALPLIIVGAFAIGSENGDGGGGEDRFVTLATAGAANFTVFSLAVSSTFLLVVLAALFVGDSVPSEASWSTLRYLLLAPVPRDRLLTSKLVVGLATMALSVVVLVLWSLLVGWVFYGSDAFVSLAGGTIEWSSMAPRLVAVTAYLVLSLLPVGAIAFALGVRTDAPLAAVGGAVMVTIVASILGQIGNLGDLRSALPLYYSGAWFDLLRPAVDYTDLRHGALWSLLYTGTFVSLGYALFRRKDILS